MFKIEKHFTILRVSLVLGCAALVPGSHAADLKATPDREIWAYAALSAEKMLPKLVSSQDYRSASNMAFLLASARKRLDQTPAACAALSQSLQYYRLALARETGIPEASQAYGIDEDSDGMIEVRAKFGCTRA